MTTSVVLPATTAVTLTLELLAIVAVVTVEKVVEEVCTDAMAEAETDVVPAAAAVLTSPPRGLRAPGAATEAAPRGLRLTVVEAVEEETVVVLLETVVVLPETVVVLPETAEVLVSAEGSPSRPGRGFSASAGEFWIVPGRGLRASPAPARSGAAAAEAFMVAVAAAEVAVVCVLVLLRDWRLLALPKEFALLAAAEVARSTTTRLAAEKRIAGRCRWRETKPKYPKRDQKKKKNRELNQVKV